MRRNCGAIYNHYGVDDDWLIEIIFNITQATMYADDTFVIRQHVCDDAIWNRQEICTRKEEVGWFFDNQNRHTIKNMQYNLNQKNLFVRPCSFPHEPQD